MAQWLEHWGNTQLMGGETTIIVALLPASPNGPIYSCSSLEARHTHTASVPSRPDAAVCISIGAQLLCQSERANGSQHEDAEAMLRSDQIQVSRIAWHETHAFSNRHRELSFSLVSEACDWDCN